MASKLGVPVKSAIKPYRMVNNNPRDILACFTEIADFDLVFVILPNFPDNVYAMVKQAAELSTGLLTQCLRSKTLQNRIDDESTFSNLLLKVNAKRDGTNHKFYRPPKCLLVPCMIMGADVTHPSPDARNIPSVAAVTASHDPFAFKYNYSWRLQPPKVEIIKDLKNITRDHLMRFYKANKQCKPQHLIFYRDGVSDGQFDEVLKVELNAIRDACKSLQKDYQPPITFLVVQKRHHTRFFPCNSRDSEDKNKNVPAGTCVDTEITNYRAQDFYLVSHASIQGVAKPTKYRTLWDDKNMNEDDLEQLTYYLCHMFTRCTRSVSYPAPTYYAHLAAARAKVYIENRQIDLDNLEREQEKFKIQDKIQQQTPMFFV